MTGAALHPAGPVRLGDAILLLMLRRPKPPKLQAAMQGGLNVTTGAVPQRAGPARHGDVTLLFLRLRSPKLPKLWAAMQGGLNVMTGAVLQRAGPARPGDVIQVFKLRLTCIDGQYNLYK